MGVSITTLAGPRPDPDSLAFPRWVTRAARLRMEAHSWEADLTIYVDAANGNDGNDGLTPSTPKQTCSAADALRDTNDGDRCEILLAGHFFLSARPFPLSDQIAYTRYKAWPGRTRPRLTLGTRFSGNTGWTLDSGTLYSRSHATEPAWISFYDDVWQIGYETTSSANCATFANGIPNTPFTWYWDDGADTLWIDCGRLMGAATDLLVIPAGEGISCFEPNADMISAWGLECVGWGTNSNSSVEGPWSVRVGGTAETLCYDCDFLGCQSHSAQLRVTSGSGGIFTAINCRAGAGTGNGHTLSSRTVRDAFSCWNAFASLGGWEALFYNVQTPIAIVPKSDWYDPSTSNGRLDFYAGKGPFGHTSSGNLSSAIAFWEPGVEFSPDRAFATSTPGNFNDAVVPEDRSAAAAYTVIHFGEKIVRKIGKRNSPASLCSAGNLRINFTYDVQLGAGFSLTGTGEPSGLNKNCFVRIDGQSWIPSSQSCALANSDPSNPGFYENCTFEMIGGRLASGSGFNHFATPEGEGDSIHLTDCVWLVSKPVSSATSAGLYVTENTVRGLLVYGFNGTGVNDISGGLDVTSYSEGTLANRTGGLDPERPPAAGDPRLIAGTRYGTIQYDANMRPRRGTHTLGHLHSAEDLLSTLVGGSSGPITIGSDIYFVG